jgi:hypothetical protein
MATQKRSISVLELAVRMRNPCDEAEPSRRIGDLASGVHYRSQVAIRPHSAWRDLP